MAQHSPSWVLSSVAFLLVGALLGSLISHGIHFLTIRCANCNCPETESAFKGLRQQEGLPAKAGDRDLDNIECNHIAKRLRDFRQLAEKEEAQLPPPADPSRPSSRDSIQEYLRPTNLLGKTEVIEAGAISLQEEYRMRKMLFVGVMTAEQYLPTRAVAVYGTWGIEVDKILFYVGEDCVVPQYLSIVPTVKLVGVPDNVYPPQRKVFMMLKHMHDHYIDEFNWFMRADDDVYARGELLMDLVDKLNPAEMIYLGRSGAGKEADMKRLKLLPHERYCMGGPGVIFSNAALRALAPHLDYCLEAIEYYNKFTKSLWYDEDVELGRCVSRKIGIQCSESLEVSRVVGGVSVWWEGCVVVWFALNSLCYI